MTPVCDTDRLLYCVGGRTAIGIQPSQNDGDRFVQSRVGLHHLCLRARSRDDVDRLHALLQDIGATVVQAPQEGTWAPGYYSVLFEDPDGIRLEANFVPGAGVLAPGVSLDPTAGYAGRDQN
jgi:catechol 2,3-dioxygenase-like lactoylglutathione lyase family enzyme